LCRRHSRGTGKLPALFELIDDAGRALLLNRPRRNLRAAEPASDEAPQAGDHRCAEDDAGKVPSELSDVDVVEPDLGYRQAEHHSKQQTDQSAARPRDFTSTAKESDKQG
jgi:hypothetical protein